MEVELFYMCGYILRCEIIRVNFATYVNFPPTHCKFYVSKLDHT